MVFFDFAQSNQDVDAIIDSPLDCFLLLLIDRTRIVLELCSPAELIQDTCRYFCAGEAFGVGVDIL